MNSILFKMKKILLIVLMLLIPLSTAYSTINIYIDESGSSLFLGEGDGIIEGLPEGVEFKDGKIVGNTINLTDKQGEIWNFYYALEDSEVQVFLPEGAKVLDTTGEISLFRNQIVVYGVGSVYIEYTLEEGLGVQDSDFVILLILGIIVAIIIYLLIKERTRTEKEKEGDKKEVDKVKTIQGILNERERIILDRLREIGKTKSSYLRQKCNIPKASFSRHIRELEKKKLVKISGEGRNKFVELVS